MINVKSYVSSNFTKAFLLIFLPFFMIISLVYLVKIATLTSQVQLTFGELLQLYSYTIPNIVFYTLPLSFVVTLGNLLIRLSQDNELIALYALGLKASKILRPLFIIALLFSILLALLSFLVMPMSAQFNKEFIAQKKVEAKLNIIAGKLGQKFGDYYIYVKENNENNFTDVVIYNRTNRNEEQFFSAQKGEIHKIDGVTALKLENGYGYTHAEDSIQQAKYDTLEAFDTTQKRPFKFEDIVAHWSKAQTDIKIFHRVLFFIFTSLIPVLSLYVIAAYTMINPRYHKNYSFIVIALTTLTLYVIASSLEKWGTVSLLVLGILTVVILGRWIFSYRVARYF